MKLLPNGIAVLEGDAWASAWTEEKGTLQYDSVVAPFILPLLKPGDTAIDIGAFIGGYAWSMIQAVRPGGKVIAFEPNPEPFECLAHNCAHGECHNVALGAKDSTQAFVLDPVNRGASFILPSQPTTTGSILVPVKTLDSFEISSVKLIKIDVEGMEPDVLVGGMDTIRKNLPIIFIEINHGALARRGYTAQDIVVLLEPLGYKLRFLDPSHSLDHAKWPQLDVFFDPPTSKPGATA